jgi:transcriptional regulator with XRE-family HTH domain
MKSLRFLRLMRGLSQVGLGRLSGVNPNTISQIEVGRFQPYPDQLNKLAAALGVRQVDAHRLLEDQELPASPQAWWGLQQEVGSGKPAEPRREASHQQNDPPQSDACPSGRPHS